MEANCPEKTEKKRVKYLFSVEYSRLAACVGFDAANVVNICRTQCGHQTVQRDLHHIQQCQPLPELI